MYFANGLFWSANRARSQTLKTRRPITANRYQLKTWRLLLYLPPHPPPSLKNPGKFSNSAVLNHQSKDKTVMLTTTVNIYLWSSRCSLRKWLVVFDSNRDLLSKPKSATWIMPKMRHNFNGRCVVACLTIHPSQRSIIYILQETTYPAEWMQVSIEEESFFTLTSQKPYPKNKTKSWGAKTRHSTLPRRINAERSIFFPLSQCSRSLYLSNKTKKIKAQRYSSSLIEGCHWEGSHSPTPCDYRSSLVCSRDFPRSDSWVTVGPWGYRTWGPRPSWRRSCAADARAVRGNAGGRRWTRRRNPCRRLRRQTRWRSRSWGDCQPLCCCFAVRLGARWRKRKWRPRRSGRRALTRFGRRWQTWWRRARLEGREPCAASPTRWSSSASGWSLCWGPVGYNYRYIQHVIGHCSKAVYWGSFRDIHHPHPTPHSHRSNLCSPSPWDFFLVTWKLCSGPLGDLLHHTLANSRKQSVNRC